MIVYFFFITFVVLGLYNDDYFTKNSNVCPFEYISVEGIEEVGSVIRLNHTIGVVAVTRITVLNRSVIIV